MSELERICQEALDCASADRAAFLDRACAGDTALRREVEALLAQASAAEGFIESPALDVAARQIAAAAVRIGERVGPYEVTGRLGAGGMGEVYRARDSQLGRDVAIKILPTIFLTDPERLARFEREARVLASLNHPNIAAIYAVEPIGPGRALVLELVPGPTLADRVARGPLPLPDALAVARQIAEALEAAHERGIVHRDLKPANVKVTPEGVAKVLDFGLAKTPPGDASRPDLTHSPTFIDGATREGVLLGTAPFMSPEQARGGAVDKRTDIWAFGCVLFEMLTGTAPFDGATVTDTLAAIIEREPDWNALPATTPAGVRTLLRRCLEKDPKRRLHDIADARIEIDDASTRDASDGGKSPRKRSLAALPIAGLVVAAAVAAATAIVIGRWRTPDPPPLWHQLTFRRGSIYAARFAPDGQSVVYSAKWEGKPGRMFTARVDSPESAALPFDNATILAISPAGRLAIRLSEGPLTPGTLAEVALTGQAPRELLTDIVEASWSPKGDALVVTHLVGGRMRLEYPPGTVLYDPGRPMISPRVSPKGDLIAFIEVAAGGGAGINAAQSRIAIVDLAGKVTILSEGWAEAFSLAWAPSGNEVWFSAREGSQRSGGLALFAVALSGRSRVVARTPGILFLRDIWSDGRVLLHHDNWPATMVCQLAGDATERDLSWLDLSMVRDLSSDGRFVLFDEGGVAEGATGGVYLRKVDGSPAVRLGDGEALGFSPDGMSALTWEKNQRQLRIVPTGPGASRIVRAEGLSYLNASWFPDGSHLLITAQEPGHLPSLYVQDTAGGSPRRIVENVPNAFDRAASPTRVAGAVSPDGRTVATIDPAGTITLTPVDGGQPRAVRGAPPDSSILRWSDSGHLFLTTGALPLAVLRFDIDTGHVEPWKTIAPADRSGVNSIQGLALSADGQSFCYSYVRYLASLFVVEGLK